MDEWAHHKPLRERYGYFGAEAPGAGHARAGSGVEPAASPGPDGSRQRRGGAHQDHEHCDEHPLGAMRRRSSAKLPAHGALEEVVAGAGHGEDERQPGEVEGGSAEPGPREELR